MGRAGFYKARIALPADITDHDIGCLLQAFTLDDFFVSVYRHDDRSVWCFEAGGEGEPDTQTLSSVLREAAGTAGLPGLHIRDEEWSFEALPDIDWLAHSY